MINQSIKKLTVMISSIILLTACGGGGGSSSNSNSTTGNNDTNTQPKPPTESETPTTTQHNLNFPIAEFKIKAVNVGLPSNIYSIKENYKTNINTLINESMQTLYQQSAQHDPEWRIANEYLLTKNKLYFAENSQHPEYFVSKASGQMITTLDSSNPDLKSTIHFKNIELENKALNSTYVTSELLNDQGGSQKNDQNWIKISNQIKNISGNFPKGSICHQYLTQQFNQPNISFSKNLSSINMTLNEWVAAQKVSNYTPKVETWAGHQVAYIPETQPYSFYSGKGYRATAVVFIDGQLHEALYDAGAVYDLREEFDQASVFNAGVCNAYNKPAAETLKTALLSLPKN